MRANKRVIIWAFVYTLISIVTIIARLVEATVDENYKAAVVEIYDFDKKLLGTGTIVSFSGLILTAKHVLKFPETSTYRLAVKVSFADTKELLRAELVAAHPYLDLAVLEIRGSSRPAWSALPVITQNKDIHEGDPIRLIGHRIKDAKLHIGHNSTIETLDFSGHIEVSKGVYSGTSGGPAIFNNKVLGVIVESDFLKKTVVTPIWSAREYFTIVGVAFGGEYAKRQNTTASLIKRVETYEAIFSDILLDLNWTAQLEMITDSDNNEGSLLVSYAKKLQAQSQFDAKLVIAVVPLYDNIANNNPRSSPKGYSDHEWLIFPKQSVIFDNLDKEFKRLAPKVGMKPLNLDIKMRVELDQIKGHISDFSNLSKPSKLEVCFTLRPTNVKAKLTMLGKGIACNKRFNYLNQILPEANY